MTSAIGYWQQCKDLALEMGKLHLPAPLIQRNLRQVAYCQLRIQQTETAYRWFTEGSGPTNNPYTDRMKALEARLDSLEKQLAEDDD
jgi:hypothetical protein